MFSLRQHKPDHVLTCMSYCGKIDRLYNDSFLHFSYSDEILRANAGLISKPESGNRDYMIARGSYEWLVHFHENPAAFSLSNSGVKALHRKIFKYSQRDDGTRGRYRTDLNDKMKDLFNETNAALDSDDRHPLFSISLFRSAFINAMPFITGNTLCANILTYALLFQNGYAIISRLRLLTLLNNAESAISQNTIDYLPRVLFDALNDFESSDDKLDVFAAPTRKAYLNPRQKRLYVNIGDNAPVKISDIMKHFPGESRNTIKKDLVHLREKKLIMAYGHGRGVFYTLREE